MCYCLWKIIPYCLWIIYHGFIFYYVNSNKCCCRLSFDTKQSVSSMYLCVSKAYSTVYFLPLLIMLSCLFEIKLNKNVIFDDVYTTPQTSRYFLQVKKVLNNVFCRFPNTLICHFPRTCFSRLSVTIKKPLK